MPRLYNFERNSYEEVPEDKVRELVLSKRYAFSDSEKVPVIAPDGSRHLVPGQNALEAFGRGGDYGSTEDWARIGRKEEYGGDSWENYLGAAATGVARGATLGLSDVALRGIIGKDRMQTWREEFSGLSTGAELTGAVLPAFFSGGGSAAVTGGQVAARAGLAGKIIRGAGGVKKGLDVATKYTPARYVYKGGRIAEKAMAESALLAKGADKGLALKILSSSLPKGIGGALEGIPFGAGTALTESMLGDPEDVADLWLSNVGLSAAFGFALPTGINALAMGGAAASKEVGKGIASLYKKTVNADMSIAAQKKFFDVTGGLLGVESETLQRQMGLWDDMAKGRAQAILKEETLRGQQDDIVANLNGILDDMATVAKNSRGVNKAGAMHGQVFTAPSKGKKAFLLKHAHEPGAKELSIQDQAALANTAWHKTFEMLQNTIDDLNNLRQVATDYSWGGQVKNLSEGGRELLETLQGPHAITEDILVKFHSGYKQPKVQTGEYKITEVLEPEVMVKNMRDIYNILDDYKKWLGQWAFGTEARNQMAWNAQVPLKSVWAGIHGLLEDTDVWGQAALTQKIVNPKFSRFIDALGNFRSEFKYRKHKGKNEWSDEWVSTETVGKYLQNLEGADDFRMEASWGMERKQHFDEFIDASEDFSRTAAKQYQFKAGTEAKKAAASAKKRFSSARNAVDKAVNDMRETRFINEGSGGQGFHPRYSAYLLRRFGRGMLGGTALGHMAFGLPGAAAGLLMGGLAEGASSARKLAQLEAVVAKTKGKIGPKLDKVIENMVKGGPGGTIPVRGNVLKGFLAPLAQHLGEESSKGGTTKQEDYAVAKARFNKLASPESLTNTMDKILEPLEGTAPNVAMAMRGTLSRGFAEAKKGFNTDNRTMDEKAMGKKERQPTDTELSHQDQRLAVIEDPISTVCDNLEAGTCTVTHVETLKNVYPQIHAQIIMGIMERFIELGEKGTYIPLSAKAQASILFQRPFDPSYKLENIGILQASYKQEEKKGSKIAASPLIQHPGIEHSAVNKLMLS
tara:strand:- start:10344 stop:13433 length:3090 start_codon:yes stop_codon:yes gene_type:complete